MPAHNPDPNLLERALARAMKSPGAMPDFYRALLASKLWFLMPHHPEMDGEIELTPGMPITFCFWKKTIDGQMEEFIPFFTSRERIEERRPGTAVGTPYAFALLEAATLFQLLASQKETVIINPACATGEVRLDPPAIAALADGSILRPLQKVEPDGAAISDNDATEMTILDPADYPTDLVQSFFEYMREHREVRAAWIFGEGSPGARTPGMFRILVWFEPISAQVQQDLVLVAKAASRPGMTACLLALNPDEMRDAAWTREIAPFYERTEPSS